MAQRYRNTRLLSPVQIGVFVFGIFLGLVMSSIGLALVINRMSFLAGTVATDGTVLSCTYNGKGACIKATLSFRTQTGQQVTVVSSQLYPLQQTGSTITVRYHPATPQDARTDADLFEPWLLVAFPVVWITVAFVKLRKDRLFKLAIKQSQQHQRGAREKKVVTKTPVQVVHNLPSSSRYKARKKSGARSL